VLPALERPIPVAADPGLFCFFGFAVSSVELICDMSPCDHWYFAFHEGKPAPKSLQ